MKWLLVVVVLLVGCLPAQFHYSWTDRPFVNESHQVIPVWIDWAFDPAFEVGIKAAIEEWNHALNGQLELRVVDRNSDMSPETVKQALREGILVTQVLGAAFKDRDARGSQVLAAATGEHLIRVATERVTINSMKPVILHEIGHVLGLSHIGGENNLMSPKFDQFAYLCVDFDSIEKVARRFRLDPDRLNFCYSKWQI